MSVLSLPGRTTLGESLASVSLRVFSFFFLCVVLRVIPLPPKVLLTIREYG